MDMVIAIKNLKELRALASKISSSLKGGETLALIGPLGAGKTTFAKALLKASGIKAKITSPTFVLMVPYIKGSKRLMRFVHMDLYRLKNFKDVQALGAPQAWGKKENVFIIEWAGKIKRHLPKNTMYLNFKIKNHSNREINITHAPKYFKI